MTDPATHPTLAALLRAVLADPHDDAPRLVLADWLKEHDRWAWADVLRLVLDNPDADPPRLLAAQWCDEHGEPGRAEFIRVQVELASFKTPWGNEMLRHQRERLDALRRRERELLKVCADALSLSFPERIGFGSLEFRAGEALAYRRGFVEAVTCTAADWVDHGDVLLACQPVTAVTLTTWPGEELTALTVSRSAAPADQAELEGLFGETSATRWCLRRLWPRVKTFTLPPRGRLTPVSGTIAGNTLTPDPEAPDP